MNTLTYAADKESIFYAKTLQRKLELRWFSFKFLEHICIIIHISSTYAFRVDDNVTNTKIQIRNIYSEILVYNKVNEKYFIDK